MTNKTTYVISDTHFGHKNILGAEPGFRPFTSIEEHDRELVERWNSVVKPHDTIWHLGDVYFGGRDNHFILGQLNGFKRLVLGNHDGYPLEMYTQYFSRIYGAAEYGQCLLTHVPCHPYQLEHRYKKNIHGHLHSKKMDDTRYVCVSVEQINLTPVLLRSVIDT